ARHIEYVGRDAGTDFTAYTWDGTRSNADGSRSDVPDGRYMLEIRALSPLGDPDNRDHVQIASTVPFIIDRDGDGEIPPIEPEEPQEPTPPAQRYGFFLNDGWDGVPEHVFQYGRHTDEVLIGDWDGDGKDTITVRRGNRYFVNNAAKGGPADRVFTYGKADDVVLVGDWDGDGVDTLAVRRGATYHVKNSLRGGDADHVIQYGRSGDDVLVGDWDGDGRDTFAVRRGATYHVKNSLRGGDADAVFTYGRSGDHVLAGDWDGDGRDTFAVRRGAQYFVKNSLRGGPADFSVYFGRADDEVYVGDWDGDGKDTIGVRRPPCPGAASPPVSRLTAEAPHRPVRGLGAAGPPRPRLRRRTVAPMTRRSAPALATTLAALGVLAPLGATASVVPADPLPAPADIPAVVSGMSEDELVGQMTWVHVYGTGAHDTSRAAENRARYGVDTPAQVVERYHLGGVLYCAWAGNTEDPEQITELSAGLQEAASAASGIPLAITVDQEGGAVSRIGPPATAFPGGMALGATADPDL